MSEPNRVYNTETGETFFVGTAWDCMEWVIKNYPNEENVKVGINKNDD